MKSWRMIRCSASHAADEPVQNWPKPSLELLDKSGRDRFAELGIFPENAHIPIGIIERLWSDHLDETETEDRLNELYDLSLLLSLDLDRRTVQIHDTIRQFLRNQTGKEMLIVQQEHLLRVLEEIGESAEADLLARRYFYFYLPYHLAESNKRQKLDAVLLDPTNGDRKYSRARGRL